MKQLMMALVVVLMAVGCQKNDDNPSSDSTLGTVVLSGGLKITYYWDSDHDETSAFNGYVFTFNGNNAVTAVKSSTTVTGTWAAGTDDSKSKLILSFASPSQFAELTEDWLVTEISTSVIKLKHVSGGNGGTDFLTFEKN